MDHVGHAVASHGAAAAAGRRGAAAGHLEARWCRVFVAAAPQQVPLLLRRARLHDLRPHGLQRGGDERGADLHGGGPRGERHADRAALRRHQHLLARRRAARRLDLRPPRPPPHHRAHQRLLPRRPAHHDARRRVRGAHGGPVHRRHRRRLRARDRAGLRRRDRARLLPRPPQLPSRDFHQHRSDAELRVQLRLLGVAGAPVVAADVRGGGCAHRVPGGGRAHHAGVTAVAGHEGPAGRGQGRARQDVRHDRRGRAAPAGDRGGRRGRQQRRRRERRHVERDGYQGRRAARACHSAGAAVLPAGVGHRLGGAVRPARARHGRRHVQHPAPGAQRPLRRGQGGLHPHRHGARRPRRPAPAAPGEHRRHDGVAARAGLRVRHLRRRQGRRGRGRRGRRGRGGLRLHLLRWVRAPGVGVQLGDPASPAARTGRRARHRHEPRHERHRHHDLHLALRGHHHGRHILPLRRRRGCLVRVHLHLPAGDPGPEPRGHGAALPHKVINPPIRLNIPDQNSTAPPCNKSLVAAEKSHFF